MSASPIHVFLSYRREASLSFARMMQLALEKRGCSVFFDYDSLQDGMIGDAIWSAIDACDVFLAVYGKGFLDRCDQSDVFSCRKSALTPPSSRRTFSKTQNTTKEHP